MTIKLRVKPKYPLLLVGGSGVTIVKANGVVTISVNSDILQAAGFSDFFQTLTDDASAAEMFATLGVSTFIQTLFDNADAAAARTTIGAQASAEISTFARTFLDDPDAAAVRTTLGVATGTGDIISTNNGSDFANLATTFATIKQAATASVTGVVKRQRVAVLREEQSSGTNAGTFTSGADQTRVLNTEGSDLDGITSLSSNQFTLQAGTWLIEWSAPAYKVDGHQTLLYNVTDAATAARGTSELAVSTTEAVTRSFGRAIVTIAGAKAFEIRHRCITTKATSGFGVQCGFGTEVYTEVRITSYDQ